MRQFIRRTDSLGGTAIEDHALALVAPTPISLLSGRVLADPCGVPPALAQVVRLFIRGAGALAGVVTEEHALALAAPPPARLLGCASDHRARVPRIVAPEVLHRPIF